MDTRTARSLMQKHANALAYIAIERVDGTRGIGSCFHVGNGVFVTARHVIEGNTITEVKITEPVAITTNLKAGPFYHPDPKVDVAVFQVSSVHPETAFVSLGSHLDDWIDRRSWQLSEAIVLGYPPIPLTSEPHLVGVRAEVNATVSLYSSRHVHFILSATPRGGFSGGLALSEYDFALGVVTQSLVKDHRDEESGFFAVLSIEPIYECLSHHKLLPAVQKEGWDDFWNTHSAEYVRKERTETDSSQLIVSLELIDDGEKIGIGLCSYDESIFRKMDALIRNTLTRGFSEIKVHETFSKYMYDFATKEIKAQIHDLLTRLMNMCVANRLVAISDRLTPELTSRKDA